MFGGYPNIAGTAILNDWSWSYGSPTATGCLSVIESDSQRSRYVPGGTSNNSGNVIELDFNASSGDLTYSGNKVQAPALQVLCCIKF